ncbi:MULTISPECIES: DUF433 domain-containing protein [Rhizobium]|uniref:DUF433 domain-containing protein n=1 Tax=Rhizobium tropici TaxID=398 RepID=A0A329YEN5_RHITR|nr:MULTISPECIES: DUF433 domain-containing protein [Rhizobium]MBB3289176.1 uncharacterized protein (DUF433 family) [Rhizobium sp. BK252]MBB3403918.1 uncharacterized protein (DUF433 family) [Rhizobium sp. BK289]MBB3416413.1 uncharacterized protein (DUF433 family) [Rhizobium sp. BK284]MBB3484381.1 uncharacterized protein (DUF433 family) [Rhizobium sp. BK347]MDK4718031.1 DUF433 domain-containing protein [Rhizobium sp. CNPSo 3968]
MATATRAYTPTEAAALSEIAVKSVHNAIDKRIIAAHLGRGGRELTDEDLLRLKLWYGVGSILTAERRKRLFETIDRNPDADTVRADDYLIVDVARAREQLAARADALREAEQKIQTVKGVAGGEPVFTGTRIPVRMIAAMRQQGASTAEIVEGYPSVTARMVELAEIWAAAHPARGRPKKLSEQGLKVKSVKRLPLAKVDS